MGRASMVIGQSKSGKTSSLRTLNPSTTIMISPLNKGLPFKGSAKMYSVWDKITNPIGNIIRTSSSKVIVQWLKHINNSLPQINVVVIDDNTFVTAKELDRRRGEKSYDKYNDIAHDFLELAEVANSLRDDLNIYILHHTIETGDDVFGVKKIKAASFGRLIEEKLHGMESQFEIVFLSCKIIDDNNNICYKFKTRDANSTCGTPMNMFEDEFVDNDLQFIDQKIRCYYNGDCNEEQKNIEEVKENKEKAK